MPDVAACFTFAVEASVVGFLHLVEQSLGGGYLIWAHHEQEILLGEYAVACEYVEQRVAREESGCEVIKVVDYLVLLVSPITCKLKRM